MDPFGLHINIAGAAASTIIGILAIIGWRRSLKTSAFFQLDHPKIIFLSVIVWSLWQGLCTAILVGTGSAPVRGSQFFLTTQVLQATLYVVIYCAYIGYWINSWIHDRGIPTKSPLKSLDSYRFFFGSSCLGLLVGAIFIMIGSLKYIPAVTLLEAWTTAMGVLMLGYALFVFWYCKRRFPPEDSHPKQVSIQIQKIIIFFVCICFALRQRMVWSPTALVGRIQFLQVSSIAYAFAEWMSIGAMLLHCFPPNPKSASGSNQSSSRFFLQLKKYCKFATVVSLVISIPLLVASVSIIKSAVDTPISKSSSIILLCLMLATLTGIGVLTFMIWTRFNALMRPASVITIFLGSITLCECFGIIVLVMTSLTKLNSTAYDLLLATAVIVSLAGVTLGSMSHKLSSYLSSNRSVEFVTEYVKDGQFSEFEKADPKLDKRAHKLRLALLISMIFHTIWLLLFFFPEVNYTMVQLSGSIGVTFALLSIAFVLARMPVATYGFIATYMYRRNINRLVAFLFMELAMDVVGVFIVIFSSVFWSCPPFICTSKPVMDSNTIFTIVILSLLAVFLIIQFIILIVFFRWYRAVKKVIAQILMDEINAKIDSAYDQ